MKKKKKKKSGSNSIFVYITSLIESQVIEQIPIDAATQGQLRGFGSLEQIPFESSTVEQIEYGTFEPTEEFLNEFLTDQSAGEGHQTDQSGKGHKSRKAKKGRKGSKGRKTAGKSKRGGKRTGRGKAGDRRPRRGSSRRTSTSSSGSSAKGKQTVESYYESGEHYQSEMYGEPKSRDERRRSSQGTSGRRASRPKGHQTDQESGGEKGAKGGYQTDQGEKFKGYQGYQGYLGYQPDNVPKAEGTMSLIEGEGEKENTPFDIRSQGGYQEEVSDRSYGDYPSDQSSDGKRGQMPKIKIEGGEKIGSHYTYRSGMTGMNVSLNNPGIELDLAWIESVRVNMPAVKRRACSLNSRRGLKNQWQAAWLVKAVTCIDLTTLGGDDTRANVTRLCLKATNPVRPDLLEALGVGPIHVAGVCVFPSRVADAVKALRSFNATDIEVVSVATSFPHGQCFLETRLREIVMAVKSGATEIDIVINRNLALNHKWNELYLEIKQMKEACGSIHMKAILAVGELGSMENVYKCSLICMMGGADFIKTSTGKESVNAILPVGVVMTRAIRDYYQRTGYVVGFKPAGGIKTAAGALSWLLLVKEELGTEWLNKDLFRIGASSLLTDVERQLFHHAYGRYGADHEMGIA